MSGRGLTAESEALVDTSIDGSGRYGGHHWPACNGFVDDEWSKCDCGLVQAAFDIEAAAARKALPSVEEMARAMHRLGHGCWPDESECLTWENHQPEAEAILPALRAQHGGEGLTFPPNAVNDLRGVDKGLRREPHGGVTVRDVAAAMGVDVSDIRAARASDGGR